MEYNNVIKDIIRYYDELLSKNEIEYLKKLAYLDEKSFDDNIIIFINQILDRIWSDTLTDIKDFKLGDDFTFLVKEHFYWYDFENKKIIDTNSDNYKIITTNSLLNTPIDEVGEIISINYTNNLRTIPLLPIYFTYSKRVDKLNYNVIGYYSADEKFKDVNPSHYILEDNFKKDKKIIYLDKIYYKIFNEMEMLSLSDLENIISYYVSEYLDINNKLDLSHDSYTLKNIILKKKQSIKKYIMLYINKELTKEELRNIIYKIIETNEDNLTKQKLK